MTICPDCKGTGEGRTVFDGCMDVSLPCATCKGTGEVHDDDRFRRFSEEGALVLARAFAQRLLPQYTKEVALDKEEIERDTMTFGPYTLRMVEKDGKHIVNLDVFVAYPYRRDEPPDGDIHELGEFSTLAEALAEIAAVEAREGATNWIMDYTMPGVDEHA